MKCWFRDKDYVWEAEGEMMASNEPCWYKRNEQWECGFFHQWSQSYNESGPGMFPVAIIEDARTQGVSHCVRWTALVTCSCDETLTPIAIVQCAGGYIDAMYAHDIELEEPEDLKTDKRHRFGFEPEAIEALFEENT